MGIPYLGKLLNRYGGYASNEPDAIGGLAERYRQYKKLLVIDLAAVATSLSLDDYRSLDPLAIRAIEDTNPNFDPARLGDYTQEQLLGIVNSAKGKYFEYLVAEKLNAGETVGDVTLPPGYHAEVAESMSQPGWDLRITDEQGQAVDFLQLKATESAGYIYDTIERYPDVVILATAEVADQLPPNAMVLDADISEQELEQTINGTLDGMDSGFLDEFWASFNPLIPLLVIAGTQGYRIVVNKQTVAAAVEVATARAARSLTAGVIGAAAKVTTNSWIISFSVALTAGLLFDRAQNIEELINATRKSNELLAKRAAFYQQLASRSL